MSETNFAPLGRVAFRHGTWAVLTEDKRGVFLAVRSAMVSYLLVLFLLFVLTNRPSSPRLRSEKHTLRPISHCLTVSIATGANGVAAAIRNQKVLTCTLFSFRETLLTCHFVALSHLGTYREASNFPRSVVWTPCLPKLQNCLGDARVSHWSAFLSPFGV
jgi:hypothetical protein